jgi:hypothetical protein
LKGERRNALMPAENLVGEDRPIERTTFSEC